METEKKIAALRKHARIYETAISSFQKSQEPDYFAIDSPQHTFVGETEVSSDVAELAAAADAEDGLISIPDLLREMKSQEDNQLIPLLIREENKQQQTNIRIFLEKRRTNAVVRF